MYSHEYGKRNRNRAASVEHEGTLAGRGSLHAIYRQRKDGILYDDAHGLLTEADLIVGAEDAFQAYDKEEEKHADRSANTGKSVKV
ncbi:MAG: hypothetical protein HY043_17665 [Verrucomicrobia bacterium]|nr:hypothetical protein [Verrucomicrobiota bacterium]